MKIRSHIPSILTVVMALLVVVISFTPLVIPEQTYRPQLFGLPYSLWMGILVTVLLVFLTWVATRIHPGAKECREKEKLQNPQDRT
ncbi:MAG: hypothetical protein ACWGNV_14370 [Bacteroidales bacterium]